MKGLAMLPLSLICLVLGGCSDQNSRAHAEQQPIETPQSVAVAEKSPPYAPLPPQANERPINPKRYFQLSDLQQIDVKIGKHTLKLWVMDTPAKGEEGMMFLTDAEVEKDEGMLFVQDEPRQLAFWMQNTLIPLDIAFIDEGKKIINIEKMRPLDQSAVPSKGPSLYQIEVKQGTFNRLGIRPGMKVDIPAGIKFKNE